MTRRGGPDPTPHALAAAQPAAASLGHGQNNPPHSDDAHGVGVSARPISAGELSPPAPAVMWAGAGRGRGKGRGRGSKGVGGSGAGPGGGATPCRFGWGCTRDGCWFPHPDGREADGAPHPMTKTAAELRGSDAEQAARAQRFTAVGAADSKPEAAAGEASVARPFAPHAGVGRSKLIVTNKEAAMRRFYVRLLRSGAVPTAAQERAVEELGLDLAKLQADAVAAAAGDKVMADKAAEKERLRARLRVLEEAAAKRGGGQMGVAEATKRRKLDSELDALAPLSK